MISLFSEFIYLWYWFTSRQIELGNMYYVFIWIKDGKRSWPILHKIIFFSGLGPGYKPSLHLQSCESDVSEIDGWTPWSRNSKPRKLWHFFVTFGAQYLGPLKMSLASHHSGTRNHYFFPNSLKLRLYQYKLLQREHFEALMERIKLLSKAISSLFFPKSKLPPSSLVLTTMLRQSGN